MFISPKCVANYFVTFENLELRIKFYYTHSEANARISDRNGARLSVRHNWYPTYPRETRNTICRPSDSPMS